MPTPGTQRVAIRIDGDLWEKFGEMAKPDRSSVLRHFIEWYVREKDVTRPNRPAAADAPASE